MKLNVFRPLMPSPLLSRAARRGREITASVRALPDFLILGTARGGTTSLFNYLAGHPDVVADVKEIHFFDNQYFRGARWYRSFFPSQPYLRARSRSRRRRVITGEASPYYLFHPLVPQRVHAVVPLARFVVLLRDPVSRAYSEYLLRVRGGLENLGFTEALAAEAERLSGWEARLESGEYPGSLSPHQRYSYVARGHYAVQLERWFSYFPRDPFLILRSEDFFADPASILQQVLAFLGLAAWEPPEYRPYNEAKYGAPDTRATDLLRKEFAASNEALERLLGQEGFTTPWT